VDRVNARSPNELLQEAREGSRAALARLITYVESRGDLHLETVALVYAQGTPHVVGLTGAPGAGKSTLSDQLISVALEADPSTGVDHFDRVAVLCVDPTSPFSGGALLGDRYRMQRHAGDERVYIRSMATRGNLGGLSLAVPDAVRVLGAVGFELVIIETVGVGQMEVDIATTADTTVVVLTPGWGDALQAEKAGILEVADVFVINKADRPGVTQTRRDLERMMDMGTMTSWRPPIIESVASEGRGVNEVWSALSQHHHYVADAAHDDRRRRRAAQELDRVMSALLGERVRRGESARRYEEQLDALLAGTTDPYRAARALLFEG
jgi:LAO/AO transport system kinase